MERKVSRRSVLKGAAGAAAGVAAVGVSKRSTAFAAPAVIQDAGSKIEVVYWGSFSGVLGDAEQAVVDQFNESQDDIVVDYQFQGSYEETAQKVTAAIAAQQPPDMALLSDVWWFKFYLNEALLPLNDLLTANEVDTEDYVDSLYEEGIRDGVNYWLPFARSTPLFYYNRDIFAEVGLPDRGPENWTEFMEWVPELQVVDGDTVTRSAFAHPSAASYIAWLFQGVIWQFNGSYSDPDFTIRINEAEGVEAGEFYRQSTVDGWATTPDDHQIDFNNGLTAAIMASTGSMAGIKENFQGEFGTAFLPEMYQFGCCTGGSGLAIMASAPPEKQEAAFEYIQFATSPEITTFWSQNTGYMPVRKSAVQSEEMQVYYEENPTFRTAVEQLELTRPQDAARVFIPNGDQIIGRGLERITITHDDVQSTFDDVARELEEEAQPVLEALEALG